ncbi:uncharacterized protein EDB93DRAFT_1105726 [Suillus bovinus]|uniref:uncharacterized protein n=1 Tax=Suillus bovinus TaxID=48563 RepID=UPI001B86B609|nr:uncharacterized protein EDB93DRAFT_1105726 [Suillus bovinus]KAG2141447.1 hypothetical protein EDB93DRAFT_1105726 [Suillus bovinus]
MKSVTSSPTKSPSKQTVGFSQMLHKGKDFDFDQETSLIKVGLHIHLAHDGTPCPSSTEYTSDLFEWSDTDENIHYDDYPEGASIPLVTDSDHPAITIVDKSGVHSLSISYCQCPGALSRDMQLFQAGLFPASFTRPKTAFTFSVLDDFLLDNLECGTSAMNYYSKIWRLTSSIFPLMVLDCYRELMRTARKWRQCKLYKWHGFAHKDGEPKAGDLALFCPACPQPGINLDLSTGTSTQPDNTPSWLFTRTSVMDGNFKAKHLHPVNPSNEVSLMDGLAFMVGDERYKSHLFNQANTSRQKLEATGIGGCACAQHRCFVPHSMVNFQKGERQMNMDYALSQALNYNTDGISHAITFYDINCQYHMFLKDQVASSMYLSIPIGMDIIPRIGHQDSCYVQYTSNFIRGTSRIDGEIMETLWASLNIISPSARAMGTPHRKEVLDYQMNDCNFIKMIRMKSLKRLPGVLKRAKSHFKILMRQLILMVILWEAEEALAYKNRMEDPTAMDIYEVRLEKDIQLLRVARLRDKLQTQITSFLKMASTYLGCKVDANEPDSLVNRDHDSPDEEDYSDLKDHDQHPDLETHASIFQPELTIVPLPSNLGEARCKALGLTDLMKEETILREGQANDALHAIRVHLVDKAVIFWDSVRSAKSQATSTQAWTRVRTVEAAVKLNARIYSKCRLQLDRLPNHNLLKKYLPLKKEHLKASTAVADPNAHGQRNATLAWFWSLDVQGDTAGND